MTTLAVQTDLQAAATLAGQVLAAPEKAGEIALQFALEQIRANKEAVSPKQMKQLSALVAQYENGATPEASPKTFIKPSDLCDLKVSMVELGTEVTFTIPKGMSGKEVLDLIEKANPRQPGDGVVYPCSDLYIDEGLDTKVTEDTKYTFTVCEKAYNGTRREQEAYLAYHNLTTVPRFVLTVGAALFRDREGFPKNRFDIGKSKDKGDLYKSLWVWARSGAVGTYQNGLHGYCDNTDLANDGVVIAGVPLPNQKS